jgi:uncharacterized protein YcfL
VLQIFDGGIMIVSRFIKLIILFVMLTTTNCVATKPVDPRVTVIDNFLTTDISITDVTAVDNKSGFMETQVTGINKTSLYKQLEYKIEWIDQNGLKIPTIMSRWTKFPAYKNSAFKFKAVAPKATATDFRIIIRKGDR